VAAGEAAHKSAIELLVKLALAHVRVQNILQRRHAYGLGAALVWATAYL
jgi:hypothetical protein